MSLNSVVEMIIFSVGFISVLLSLYQSIVGKGTPLAMQCSVTVEPF